MSVFTVASFGTNQSALLLGQSFTPNVPGPNGSGSPGTATQAYVTALSVGYGSGNITNRARTIYVYGVELTDPDQIGQSDYLVTMSGVGNYDDGTGLFGTGTYQRTFYFPAGALDPTHKYYAYFERSQNLQVQSGSPYSGGSAYDTDLSEVDGIATQFQVQLYT